jgi:hypothetical protein
VSPGLRSASSLHCPGLNLEVIVRMAAATAQHLHKAAQGIDDQEHRPPGLVLGDVGALMGAKSTLELMRGSQHHMPEGDARKGQAQQPLCKHMMRVGEGDFEDTTVQAPAGAEQAWDTGQDEPDHGTWARPKVLQQASGIHPAAVQAFNLGWVIDPQRREQAWFVGPASRALAPDAVVRLGRPASRRNA